MEAIRVVIADDSALVLAGVEAMLTDGIRAADSANSSSALIEVCGRASSLGELYAQVAASTPDVVVTDIRMPPNHDDEGIAAALHLRDTAPIPCRCRWTTWKTTSPPPTRLRPWRPCAGAAV